METCGKYIFNFVFEKHTFPLYQQLVPVPQACESTVM